MPNPKPNETRDEFVSRYMSSEEAKKDFPDEKQRLAVAFSKYREHQKKSKKEFDVILPVIKMWTEKSPEAAETDEPDVYFKTIVSGTKEDRDGEVMDEMAINDMISQFKSGKIPLFPDHGRDAYGNRTYSWKNIMGVWVDAEREGENLVAVARLNKAHPDAKLFQAYMKEKMPIGFSIGGHVIDFVEEDI